MRVRLESFNPFRHAIVPAAGAFFVLVVGGAWQPAAPLLGVAGFVIGVIGARIAVDHRGLGTAWLDRRPESASLSARETRLVDGTAIALVGLVFFVFGLMQL